MKKIARKAVPLACAITAPFFLSADDQNDSAGMLCATPNKAAFGGSKMATTTNGNSGASSSKDNMMMNQITPPVGPTVQNGADVFITADFIYWRAQEDGLEYAFNGPLEFATAGTGKMKTPDFTPEPGFKVGLGVLCGHDNWDIYAEYTWLNVTSGDTSSTLKGSGTTSNLVQVVWDWADFSTLKFAEASASWHLNFNVLDFEMGRNFWISKRLSLRPHLGLKFSWMKQDYDITGTNFYDGQSFTGVIDNYDLDQKQFGVGIRSGLDSAYYLWNKWAIFGDFAVTGLWNYFHESRQDSFQTTASSDPVVETSLHQRTQELSMVLELTLGLRFETIFSKARYKYVLQAGWETQVWFNQNHFIHYSSHTPADLSFQGLTIKTGFWF